MSDIIHLLPDSIANQIAAGEVIQRPASVVKELVENAIDAGALRIQVIVKDAGRTLIQVIDDGKGMSETDARLAFERHATSKIRQAEDLFSLRTMGFRGEALPSIVAVAQVEMKTRRAEDELGTFIAISGSQLQEQSHVSAAVGTDIAVRNLFFNVPARRKFLKANATELRQIMVCFQRIALVYPDIAFELYHNDVVIYSLKPSNLRQRIDALMGKKTGAHLLELKEENEMVKIHGFVGTPETAKKKEAQTFFFVNGRYMNHSYFHKAVMQAYDRMLPADTRPNYFIYFDVDPATIDVNVHPTKTEIKFENENYIWSILQATVKETLGKFNILPPMSFEPGMQIINDFVPSEDFAEPQLHANPNYNPFEAHPVRDFAKPASASKKITQDWEKLYSAFENEVLPDEGVEPQRLTQQLQFDIPVLKPKMFQFQKKYIVTPMESGLMLIDQHRAHVRVLYERNMKMMTENTTRSQALLFPERMELNPSLLPLLHCLNDDLKAVGYVFEEADEELEISAIPAELSPSSALEVLSKILNEEMNLDAEDIKSDIHDRIALAMAKSAAVKAGAELSENEMEEIYNALFASENNAYTPDGKTIVAMVSTDEIEKRF